MPVIYLSCKIKKKHSKNVKIIIILYSASIFEASKSAIITKDDLKSSSLVVFLRFS